MWLIASEDIAAGGEIRVDLKTFDGGRRGTKRSEPAWRKLRLRPPPPGGEEPTFGRPTAKLRRLCDGASSTVSGEAEDEDGFESDSEQYVRAVLSPLPWEGPAGGDARLRRLVPPLQRVGPSLSDHAFGLVATHLPGRTGAECASRWALLRGAPAAKSKSAK
mmetsp:Transcript_21458/g.68538  ORF Transcript_21458/g.68538 Transcript_21458/m.68538 type:complete len:162 (-) Transcript_21458:158-643(-)